ncbi:MAG TPA: hypothetical protein VE621_17135, partial [Bryobacteraceae bacterium]|nr:hypothetical protein [Bryobacteraceae bacterium]
MRKNPTLFGTNAIAAFAVAVIGAAASGGATTAERLAVSPAFNLTGTSYSQNFNNTGADNALASTGTSSTTPAGWGLAETGTNANTIYTANNGGSNTGETYSYGATGSSERAFGALRSGSLVPTFGACFANATGQSITSVQISYAGELWRRGGTNRTDRIDFQYAIGATDLSTGTYVNVDTLDYTSPSGAAITGSGGNSTPLDSQTISGSFTPTGGIAPNQTFCVRWTDFDPSGADDGIGVDDFNMTLTLQPLNQVSLSPTSLPAGVAGSLYNSGTITAVNGSGCTFTSTPADTLSNAGLQLNTTGTNTATVTGTPTQAGPVSFTLNAECTTNGNAQQAYTITVNAAPAIGSCGASKTFIGTAQSSGTSGTVGATVTIEGVVTGFFLSNTGVREGFYVQDADNENDGTTATSDGIFVYDQNNSFAGTLSVGNKVRLRGQVAEFSTLTEIVPNAGELIV